MPRVYENVNVESDFGGRFPWKSRRIAVGDGVRQAVIDEGPRTAPVTFVLLHGNPTWGFIYRKFVTDLARDYRVVVPDHVGFGRSDKPRDPAYYTLERHIANLAITLEQLNVTRAVLVMQDWGGPIGMGWATRHAERVAGFVVMNTWSFVEQPPLKLPWLFKFLVLGKGGWKRATQSNFFTEMFLIRGSRLDAATADAYRAPHPTPDDRIGIARFPQLIPETANPAHESRRMMAAIEGALPSIADRPALLIWAAKDRAFDAAQLERWRTLFGNLDGPHLLSGAGHFLQEDAPNEIVPRLRAWAEAQFRAAHPQTPR